MTPEGASGALPSHWLVNGHLRPEAEVNLSPWDRGFRFGDGLYETIRVHRGRIFRLREHLARMAGGLDILGIDLDPASAFPDEELARLIAASSLARGEGRLRLFVTRGVDRGTAQPVAEPRATTLAAVEALAPGAPLSDPRQLRLVTVTALAPRPAAWASLKRAGSRRRRRRMSSWSRMVFF
jgi:branched-chain amino acid aminotransferase